MGGLADASKSDTVAWSLPVISSAAEKVFSNDVTATNTLVLSTAQFTTNHCWTAVQGASFGNAEAVKNRAALGGYSGSITTCLKHAVDGYSFWGATIVAKVGGLDWSAIKFLDTGGAAGDVWSTGVATKIAVEPVMAGTIESGTAIASTVRNGGTLAGTNLA